MRSLVMLSLATVLALCVGARDVHAQAAPAASVVAPGQTSPQQLSPDSGDADAVLAQLRESVTFARFAEAIDVAGRFLRRTDLAARHRNAALEALAIVQIATRSENEARATLEELYRRDPQHRLTDADASPRVQSAFARARDAHPAPIAVRLEQAPLDLRTREAPLVAVHVAVGADAVSEIRLAYRHEGDPGFTRVVMSLEQAVARARMPLAGDPSRTFRIDYFVEAVAPSLTPLAHLGSEAEPLVAQIPAAQALRPAQVAHDAVEQPPNNWATAPGGGSSTPSDEGSSVTSQWWFWTIIAVVVAGGAVGTYFALSSGGEPPMGTLGSITLN